MGIDGAMQTLSRWIPDLSHGYPYQQHCAYSTPLQSFTPAPTGSRAPKRSRSNTAELSPPTSWSHTLSAGADGPPPSKRVKIEGALMPGTDEQAQPAAQEAVPGPSRSQLLPTSRAANSVVEPSSSHNTAVVPSSVDAGVAASESCTTASQSYLLNQVSGGSTYNSASDSSPKMTAADRLKLRDAIQWQFNLMILRKNEELRLIEQEQAKAQIALEQLRRCRQIPYPGQPGSATSLDQLLDHTAPALASRPGYFQPSHPPAWGIADGPYTKHYARWLIPDPQFDSEPLENHQPSMAGSNAESKSRGADFGGQLHRRQRHSTGGKIDSPATAAVDRVQATPKEKSASSPQVMKRGDQVWVQLVCRECGTDVFRSVQGFMNHMRIQHEIRLKSHAQAANDFGVPVDGPNAPHQTNFMEASTPVTSVSKPVSGQVHSLNAPMTAQMKTNSSANSRPGLSSHSMNELIEMSQLNTGPRNDPAKSAVGAVVPSSNIPALSGLAQSLGGHQDLAALYTQMAQKVDLDSIEPLIPDHEVEEVGPAINSSDWRRPPVQAGVRAPVASVRTQNKPPSIQVPCSDGSARVNDHEASFATWSSSPHESQDHRMLSPMAFMSTQDAHMHDLSPHGIPPGLVTDHEDDDEMEDEVKSVVEHPIEGQQNVRIFSENAYPDMSELATEAKNPIQHWQPHPAFGPQGLSETPVPAPVEKKRRGRPSKKGKEKITK